MVSFYSEWLTLRSMFHLIVYAQKIVVLYANIIIILLHVFQYILNVFLGVVLKCGNKGRSLVRESYFMVKVL